MCGFIVPLIYPAFRWLTCCRSPSSLGWTSRLEAQVNTTGSIRKSPTHIQMKFNCPKCSQPIEVGDSHAGQTGNCPSCGELVLIPVPSSPVLQPAAAAISQNATVTVTTKNTTALTMWIIAIVLGVFGLLVTPNTRSSFLQCISAIITTRAIELQNQQRHLEI